MRQNLADLGPRGSRTRAVGSHTPSCGQSLAHLDLSKILSLASSPWVGVDMGECSSTPLGGFGELALAKVGRRSRSSLASEGVAMRTKLVLAVVVAMSLGGCTTTQESIGGGAVGGVAGLAVAGPIGAVAGATAGAVATPMAGWGLN